MIILITLTIGIGFVIFYFSSSQNNTIIESRENAAIEESEIVYMAIRNNMLAGEAPIAVELFNDFAKSDFLSDVMLYRANGYPAFYNDDTIKTVNRNLGRDKFIVTRRFPGNEQNTESSFTQSVVKVDDQIVRILDAENKSLLIYKPLINQPKCSACHGTDHVIRGVIKISTPLNDVYDAAQKNTVLSIVIFLIVVIILTVFIIMFINRTIIRRVNTIGDVVNLVGEGDLTHKIQSSYSDELGYLSGQINSMIDGLREKLKLSKFVSRSTLEHVKNSEEISLGGEKKEVTVLFTDIRGFTSYSEKRDPSDVMEVLNKVMNLQSEIITSFGGDIDKYVGDEIMAVFEGDDMILRALRAAEKIRNSMIKEKNDNPESVTIGIGINTGTVISGNMGALDRIDRTVIGDTVNLGARLCSAAAGNIIVVSEFTQKPAEGKAEFREHQSIKVKGKEKPVKIFTLRKVLK
ncbi:MAG: adenylate/guanylate cyclase domain-containing protein [Spirochaetes bacterium]|nr:adenylate/guanylate cyclase domain-containing protein [Spirochaetota bacterium]